MTCRHIEMAIPKKTLEDLIAAHLYSVSYANDNEDIEIEFKAPLLRNAKADSIPITIKMRSEV